MPLPTKDFERFMAKAKRVYAELETLPRHERVAIVTLLDNMLEYQLGMEDQLADDAEDARDDQGEQWKKTH